MNKLAKVLLKDENYESVNVIRSAKVPLIKLVETKTGYNFDISFNKLDGVKQIKEIHKGMSYYPEMRYLTILLKCFLKQRDLNETYTGGIGSFLLFCLILTFLREIKREYISQDRENEIPDILLSEYLLKFMDFYANFDISSKQIIIAEGGAIVDKYVKEYALSVISPQEATHDVGGPCFKAREVFGVFKNRFNFLMNYNFKEGESVLKYLISADLI
jgi:non-canonical poly(A) RNA polymerase PAPD5/7